MFVACVLNQQRRYRSGGIFLEQNPVSEAEAEIYVKIGLFGIEILRLRLRIARGTRQLRRQFTPHQPRLFAVYKNCIYPFRGKNSFSFSAKALTEKQ